eukprot:COSAG05_NODE_465_length_9537_cov_21.527086_9_plen_215_part_00
MVELSLAADITTIVPGSPARKAFEAAFKQDVRAALTDTPMTVAAAVPALLLSHTLLDASVDLSAACSSGDVFCLAPPAAAAAAAAASASSSSAAAPSTAAVASSFAAPSTGAQHNVASVCVCHTAQVAAMMGGNVTSAAIQIIDVRAGSVIVTFYVHALNAAMAAAAVSTMLQTQAANPTMVRHCCRAPAPQLRSLVVVVVVVVALMSSPRLPF